MAKNDSGFTLLELIIVMLLIGIITFLVAPRLAVNRPELNLKIAAKSIAGALRYAGNESVSRNKAYAVILGLESARVYIFPADIFPEGETLESFVDKIEETSVEDVEAVALPEGIAVEKAEAVGPDPDPVLTGWFPFYFYPSGSTSGGTVYLINVKESRAIIRAAFVTGVVSIEMPEE